MKVNSQDTIRNKVSWCIHYQVYSLVCREIRDKVLRKDWTLIWKEVNDQAWKKFWAQVSQIKKEISK